MIESVFVILPSDDNSCIFFGQLDETAEEIEDLEIILGTIVDYAQGLGNNQGKALQLRQGKFVYGKFDQIYLIFKIKPDADMNKVKIALKNTAKGFLELYKNELENYQGDPGVFDDFSDKIGDLLAVSKKPSVSISSLAKPISPNKQASKSELQNKEAAISSEQTAVKSGKDPYESVLSEQRKTGRDLLKSPKAIEFVPEEVPEVQGIDSSKPIIKPIKREAYPNGIEDWQRDEICWNESQSVMNEYTAEFVDGVIAKLQIFLSISITHHYDIIIDFQNYPKKPIISGAGALDGDLEKYSYFLNHWDEKVPPHIIELVREFETILIRLKTEGKLEPTSEMPEDMMPELEPLEKLPPLPPLPTSNKKEDEKESTPAAKSSATPSTAADAAPSDQIKDSNQTVTAANIAKKSTQKPSKPTPQALPSSNANKSTSKPISIEKNKKELEKKRKLLEKKKKEEEKLKLKKKKQMEKEEKKKLKMEKKEEKKQLKEILKEGLEDAKKELK